MLFGTSGIAGGALVGILGGPKRKMLALIIAIIVTSLFGSVVLGVGRNLLVWRIGAFLTALLLPMGNWASRAIWQSKIPSQLQGRVFSVRIPIGQIGGAIRIPVARVLADRACKPLMSGTSPLAQVLVPLVGRGPGAEMGLMFVLFGAAGFAYRPIREIERVLPDIDPDDPAEPQSPPTT